MPRRPLIVLVVLAAAAAPLAFGLWSARGAYALARAAQWLERAPPALTAVVILLALTLAAGITATVIGLLAYRRRKRPGKRRCRTIGS